MILHLSQFRGWFYINSTTLCVLNFKKNPTCRMCVIGLHDSLNSRPLVPFLSLGWWLLPLILKIKVEKPHQVTPKLRFGLFYMGTLPLSLFFLNSALLSCLQPKASQDSLTNCLTNWVYSKIQQLRKRYIKCMLMIKDFRVTSSEIKIKTLW